MPDITQPSNIPTARMDDIKSACGWPAHRILKSDYPYLTPEGQPDLPLSNAQAAVVFEMTTRRMWRRLMADGKRKAEMETLEATIEADLGGPDPFE